MINSERGEVAITLEGTEYPMRPSYEAMLAIEKETGCSLENLFLRATAPGAGLFLTEKAIIVTEAVKAAGVDRKDKMLQQWNQEKVGRLLFASGLSTRAAIQTVLENMITGGTTKKNAAPRRKKRASSTAN